MAAQGVWPIPTPQAVSVAVDLTPPQVHGKVSERADQILWKIQQGPVAKVAVVGSLTTGTGIQAALSLAGHQIYVEETSRKSEGGEENSAGVFYRWSKRYKELTLEGPDKADKLLIKVEARRAFATKESSWPAGRVAHLTPA